MNSRFPATAINIASWPFQRERARNAILVVICIALSCSLLSLLTLVVRGGVEAAEARTILNSENTTMNRIQMEKARYSNILSRPENADVFAWSVLLNELLARRGLSWARIFEDLGTVMPSNMCLVGIRAPQVAAEDAGGTNRVQLDMVVATGEASTIIDLLNALQRSDLFGPATVMSQTSPTQNDPLCRFRVQVAYAQRL